MSVRILIGDARERLRELPAASVQCAVTSPPYWRQRDYGVAGQIGLELTPEEYVERLREIFAEVRRVVRDDGTLWLNIGDKWAADTKWGGSTGGKHVAALHGQVNGMRGRVSTGLKDKDLVGVPWMLAFALRADGWFLRQCNIWAKPNCMPESVTDRSTISHEYVFHLSKSGDYFYDIDAARTPFTPSSETRLAQNVDAQESSARGNGGRKTNGPMKAVQHSDKQRGHTRRHQGFNERWDAMERTAQVGSGANLRSVWWIAPSTDPESHFAMMPAALAEICIVSASRPGDTILDPFGGAGTTGLVADRLKRNAILIELNPAYAAMAERRIAKDAGMFADVSAA